MAAIPSTSLFIPVEYPQTEFYAVEFGSDATATTFVFQCATETSCGPITVIQGPNTVTFSEADQPITTVWDCGLYGTPATSASCLVTSTSPGHSFPGASTSIYPSAPGDAFPTYQVVITAVAATPGVQRTGSSSRAELFSILVTGSESGPWGFATATGDSTTTTSTNASVSAAVASAGVASTASSKTSSPAATTSKNFGTTHGPHWKMSTISQILLCLLFCF